MSETNDIDKETLRTKLNQETSKIAWKELQRFFASGSLVAVTETLDLIDAAFAMACDDKAQVEQWLATGEMAKVSDQQARDWFRQDATLWAVVIRPWILVQEARDKSQLN